MNWKYFSSWRVNYAKKIEWLKSYAIKKLLAIKDFIAEKEHFLKIHTEKYIFESFRFNNNKYVNIVNWKQILKLLLTNTFKLLKL